MESVSDIDTATEFAAPVMAPDMRSARVVARLEAMTIDPNPEVS
jgi:hypothetical protein